MARSPQSFCVICLGMGNRCGKLPLGGNMGVWALTSKDGCRRLGGAGERSVWR